MSPENRLARERSPYLLQHARNPVDWYPWGDEVFERARREDKPVFVSIGYSACHWCHVMEHESFEDAATAKLLNDNFVSVKVDREERPDIDQIYQLAHQVLTQRAGGWPLSVFLTPDKRPFYAGTYFPNVRRHGLSSFADLLAALLDAYRNRRGEVDEQATELTRVLFEATAMKGTPTALDAKVVGEASAAILQRASPNYGGFGRAPKFPNTMTLDLLAIAASRGNKAAREHYLVTLDHIARGGIYDHLGGGFARYSTDERWLIPHFEKMLYDNAQLAREYLSAWRLVGDGGDETLKRDRCMWVVLATLVYVAREMTDPVGVFYSAQDADSEGVEGKFFAWTPSEIEAVVGKEDAELVCKYFDVSQAGNFEHGTSVLWTPRSIEQMATAVGRTPREVQNVVTLAKDKLFDAREKRVHPARDDKSLAAWNALMISAMADAGSTFDLSLWVDAAERALGGLARKLAWHDKHLAHAMKNGEAYGTGYLDDYAGLACAALDVYEARFAPETLAFARDLVDAMIERFWDDATSTFFYTPSDAEVVLQRPKEPYDHAYPSGMGLAADALLRLATVSGVVRYRTVAEQMLSVLAESARRNPMGFGTVLRAIDRATHGDIETVVIGDPTREDTRRLIASVRAQFIPHRTLVAVPAATGPATAGVDRALLEGRTAGEGGAGVAYVCRFGSRLRRSRFYGRGGGADTIRRAVSSG